MVDTLLTFFVIRYAWRYPLWLCVLAHRIFPVDRPGVLLARRCSRSPTAAGSRSPSAPASSPSMTTWRRGREHLFGRLRASSVPLEDFLKSLFLDPPHARAGHRGVPHRHARGHAARAAAQPQPQQGAARARGVPDRRGARGAVGVDQGAGGVPEARQRLLARARQLRLPRPARRDPGARSSAPAPGSTSR